MATEYWRKNGATWRRARELWMKDGSTWRKARELWMKDGSTWRKVFAGGVVALTTLHPYDDELAPTDATASVTIENDGSITYVGNTSSGPVAWFDPTGGTPGDNYWCKLVNNSGTAPSGSALNTVLALTSARTWSLSETGTGSKTSNNTLTIYADAGGTDAVGSATVLLDVNVAL